MKNNTFPTWLTRSAALAALLFAIAPVEAQVRYGQQGSSGLMSIPRNPPSSPLEQAWGYNPSWYYGIRHPPGYSGYYPGYYSYSGYTGPSQPRDYPTYYRGLGGLDPVFPPPDAVRRSPLPPPAAARGATPRDNRVTVEVRVPPDAEVWLQDTRMQQTGAVRQFVSPPLTPGYLYTYDIRARWTENGREVTRTRQLSVLAGYPYQVDFTTPAADAKAP